MLVVSFINTMLCWFLLKPLNHDLARGRSTYPLQAAPCRQVRPASSGMFILKSPAGLAARSFRTQSTKPFNAAAWMGNMPAYPRLQLTKHVTSISIT